MILAWYVRCERKKNCNRHPSLESQWCAFWLDPVWKWTKWGVATILDSWWNIQACNVYFAEGSSGGGVAKHCLDQRETFGRWRLLSDVIEHCNVLHRLQETTQTLKRQYKTVFGKSVALESVWVQQRLSVWQVGPPDPSDQGSEGTNWSYYKLVQGTMCLFNFSKLVFHDN